MKTAKFFRVLLLSILGAFGMGATALLTTATTVYAHVCETSCSTQCFNQITEWERITRANEEYCGGGDVTCVKNCTERWSDGSCKSYGPDYCGRNAVCIQRCSARWSDGSCKDYTADLCGEGPLNCAVKCDARWSDGSCKDYGDDHCGRNASCQAYCSERWPDGSCKTYGADICRP